MPTILVIDDDTQLRELIAMVLTSRGHVVETTATGAEGIRLHQHTPADLVITDVVMPEMDGIEFAGQLRRLSPQVPLIAMSGSAYSELYLNMAKLLGAKHVITKPFQLDAFVELVETLLSTAPSVDSAAAAHPAGHPAGSAASAALSSTRSPSS